MNAMTITEYHGLGAEALEAICKLADMLQTTPKRAMELYLAHEASEQLKKGNRRAKEVAR